MRAAVRIWRDAVFLPVTCRISPCLPVPFPLFLRTIIAKTMLQLISSNAPVSESIINPRTTMSLGTSGWVLMVSTVLRTDSGVSLNPSSQFILFSIRTEHSAQPFGFTRNHFTLHCLSRCSFLNQKPLAVWDYPQSHEGHSHLRRKAFLPSDSWDSSLSSPSSPSLHASESRLHPLQL